MSTIVHNAFDKRPSHLHKHVDVVWCDTSKAVLDVFLRNASTLIGDEGVVYIFAQPEYLPVSRVFFDVMLKYGIIATDMIPRFNQYCASGQALTDVSQRIANVVLFVQRRRDNEQPRHPIACTGRRRIPTHPIRSLPSQSNQPRDIHHGSQPQHDQRHIKLERIHMWQSRQQRPIVCIALMHDGVSRTETTFRESAASSDRNSLSRLSKLYENLTKWTVFQRVSLGRLRVMDERMKRLIKRIALRPNETSTFKIREHSTSSGYIRLSYAPSTNQLSFSMIFSIAAAIDSSEFFTNSAPLKSQ
ncbi:hypothetical protein [Burkholderia diffusa]|uniref:hypothetical protein n=1 Tax=Burkholderia diffusa TaxID=488732 RepID=UPI002AB10432|nr:hypothetical protein [Burkholderia diffusa]